MAVPDSFTPVGTPQAAAVFAATPQHLPETLLAHGKARCGCPETGSASGEGMMLMHLCTIRVFSTNFSICWSINVMPSDQDNSWAQSTPHCTVAYALARMIGWGHPQPTSDSNILEQVLQHKDELVLALVRAEAVKSAAKDQAESATAAVAVSEKKAAVLEHEEKIERLYLYSKAIEIERRKRGRPSSLIAVDCKSDGSPVMFTLASVEWWARKEFGVSIIDPMPYPYSVGTRPEQTEVLQEETLREKGPAAEGWLSPAKARNIYTTFGFLVEAYSKTATGYQVDGRPNVKVIAERLGELAAEVTKPDKFIGQDSETIRKLISLSLKTKRLPP